MVFRETECLSIDLVRLQVGKPFYVFRETECLSIPVGIVSAGYRSGVPIFGSDGFATHLVSGRGC